MFDKSAGEAGPVSFGERLANSDLFAALFRDGMALVEETASYLDGPGRAESKKLERTAALAYATESMRLTTRLMQLASWLLLQRATGAGEMTSEEARKEKHRISLSDIGRGHPLNGSEQLPDALKDLVERSIKLHARVQKLDVMLNVQAKSEPPEQSLMDQQLDRIATAFKAARG